VGGKNKNLGRTSTVFFYVKKEQVFYAGGGGAGMVAASPRFTKKRGKRAWGGVLVQVGGIPSWFSPVKYRTIKSLKSLGEKKGPGGRKKKKQRFSAHLRGGKGREGGQNRCRLGGGERMPVYEGYATSARGTTWS